MMKATAIIVDGCAITSATLREHRQVGRVSPDLADFLRDWWDDSPTMQLQTSGSTGAPKQMLATKAAMAASATATCRFFGLKPGNSALLCLPLRYIAGKMMVVRALAGGLNLLTAEPSSTPLTEVAETIDFAPLVPMQAAATLARPDGAAQLERVRTLLLGGGFIDSALSKQLQDLSTRVYASYGMTETLSHIALRAVNGPQHSEWYTPLPGVELTLTPAGTLQISVPWLGINELCTNDLAEIAPNGRFRILGRVDAVINSGGVKIQAEEIEHELHQRTGLAVLALPLPHPRLGQCVALLWEGPAESESTLREACTTLPRYHQPHFIHHATLPRTESGKPARAQARQILTLAYEH